MVGSTSSNANVSVVLTKSDQVFQRLMNMQVAIAGMNKEQLLECQKELSQLGSAKNQRLYRRVEARLRQAIQNVSIGERMFPDL